MVGHFPCRDTGCKKVYKNKSTERIHYKKAHLGIRFTCPKCERVYTEKSNMTRHNCANAKRTSDKETIVIARPVPIVSEYMVDDMDTDIVSLTIGDYGIEDADAYPPSMSYSSDDTSSESDVDVGGGEEDHIELEYLDPGSLSDFGKIDAGYQDIFLWECLVLGEGFDQ